MNDDLIAVRFCFSEPAPKSFLAEPRLIPSIVNHFASLVRTRSQPGLSRRSSTLQAVGAKQLEGTRRSTASLGFAGGITSRDNMLFAPLGHEDRWELFSLRKGTTPRGELASQPAEPAFLRACLPACLSVNQPTKQPPSNSRRMRDKQ